MRKDIYERIRVLKMDEIKLNFDVLAKALIKTIYTLSDT